MPPVIPVANPLPLPAPPGLLWALLQAVFLLHLVAMNVVLGGSLLTLHWRFSRRSEGAAHRAALLGLFAKALPAAVAAAVTLGVAVLLFVQVLYGRLFFTSSILMAWLWLAVVPLVILALGATNAVPATWAQAGLLAGTLVAMVLLRDEVRQLALRDAGFAHPPWVVTQWAPLAVFGLLLVGAAATIAWMTRALAGSAARVGR
jgi:hypothetical protein